MYRYVVFKNIKYGWINVAVNLPYGQSQILINSLYVFFGKPDLKTYFKTFVFLFISGGVCVGSICWTMVTFGAVTLMQTVGHDRSLVIMERADPLLLLVVLPLVPVGLIIGQMIRWEETVRKRIML